MKNEKVQRIKTYIKGLDENLQGGIPEGHIVLVCGSAGTMKSSMSFNILYNEVLNGKTAIYITLEQSCASLLKHMENMQFDLSKINIEVLSDISGTNGIAKKVKLSKTGTLIISDLGAIRKKMKNVKFGASGDWLGAIKNLVGKLKLESKCDLFALDSLAALYVLSDFEKPRAKIFHIFEFLRDLKLTSFILSEMPLDQSTYSKYEVEDFLADGILYLQLAKRYRKVTREISIVKMRATDCNTNIFSLVYKNKNFQAIYGGKTPLIE
ncbi:MAG: ATPase domain-containing protein [Nitrospinota bacterium]|jgi:KaiC/GvpD/RAD55 family RecA-like ATPase|nr:ATPase domain-containing protein [Nitrospinota bacterium]